MRKCILVLILLPLSTLLRAQKTPATPALAPAAIDYHQMGAPLPPLRVITLDTIAQSVTDKGHKKHKRKHHHDEVPDSALVYTRIITDKNVPNKGNLFMMTFNPTCGHCEDQTEQFIKNMGLFKNSNLVMVTNPLMKGYLPDFIKNHHIRNYPLMQVGVDSAGYINNTFLYGSLPQINIYDKNLKLLKTYQGEIVMDSLKQYIN